MHIEPGILHGAKTTLTYAAAAGGLVLATVVIVIARFSDLVILAGTKAGCGLPQNNQLAAPRPYAVV